MEWQKDGNAVIFNEIRQIVWKWKRINHLL